uniref:Leucine-rich repeat serine/threonine-protein kinase 2-like n=1 Tax=Sinocyclocheilus anshuiensis TaxID=1608454 RepID=A0A671LLT2_9TELE
CLTCLTYIEVFFTRDVSQFVCFCTSGRMRALLLSHGIHVNIVHLMQKHANSSAVCESACRLLYTLFQGARASLDDGTLMLGQILTALKTHNFIPEVQLEGLRASLVLLSPGRLSVCFLSLFISSEEIQECGLGVLSALADSSGAVDLMCQQGAIDTVLHTLQMFPQEQIHYWGLSLLFHLISKKKLSRMMVPVLASVLVSSVRQHKEDTVMLLKVAQYSYYQFIVKRFVVFDVFFLQGMSCLCLSKMVADSEILYTLLERACEDGDVDMAECFIHLGADINKKTKSDSLIYQVCDRGAPLALLELLVSAGVHEQQLRGALSVCVRRGDDPAITLLLGRLGLDHANNALCLGSFRLRQMKASWLSALLSERKTQSPVTKKNSESMKAWSSCFITWRVMVRWFSHTVNKQVISLDVGLFLLPFQSRFMFYSLVKSVCFCFKCTGQGFMESSTPGAFPLAIDKEPIRLLDLSGNELGSLSCLMGASALKQQIESLLRLDLSGNSLSELPSVLCQHLRGLTRLDLQGNQLQSLPVELLGLPALSTLNVSRNCIGPLLLLDPTVCSPALRQLNLSFNQITVFPFQLGQAMDRLEELSLEGNQISALSLPLRLAELKVLDISKNQVKIISDNFLTECLKLETFIASVNQISSLSHLPSKITTVKLSQNNFTSVPEIIISLPNLRSVDMRNNSISVLPGPALWVSVNLRELMFSHNHISVLDLSGPVYKWARLEKLHLSSNKLTEVRFISYSDSAEHFWSVFVPIIVRKC